MVSRNVSISGTGSRILNDNSLNRRNRSSVSLVRFEDAWTTVSTTRYTIRKRRKTQKTFEVVREIFLAVGNLFRFFFDIYLFFQMEQKMSFRSHARFYEERNRGTTVNFSDAERLNVGKLICIGKLRVFGRSPKKRKINRFVRNDCVNRARSRRTPPKSPDLVAEDRVPLSRNADSRKGNTTARIFRRLDAPFPPSARSLPETSSFVCSPCFCFHCLHPLHIPSIHHLLGL